MRLKKSKEPDAKKSQQIDSISRLICTSKTQTHPLSGTRLPPNLQNILTIYHKIILSLS